MNDEDGGNVSMFSTVKKKLTPSRMNVSRLVYSIFIVSGFLIAIILRGRAFGLINTEKCSEALDRFGTSCQGKYFVYRISASLVVFFTILAFLSSRLFCVGDRIRLYIHYKWLLLKIFLFLMLLALPILITDKVFYVYAWIALFASGVFMIIQVILLVDSAHAWQEEWRSDDQDGKTIWDYLLLVVSLLSIAASIAFIVVGYVYFGFKASCPMNITFLSVTILLCIVVVVGSIVANKGILPGSIVCCYCAYLCWSALMSSPGSDCNKFFIDSEGQNSTASNVVTTVIGLLIACASLIRTAVSTGGGFSKFFSLKKRVDGQEEDYLLKEQGEEDDGKEENREECSQANSSYVVFVFMSFYLAMVLCNWEIEQTHVREFETDRSVTAVWVKIVCQWLTVIVFGWTLIAPKILKNRDFN
ncbi:serine incorporator [Acrasis kona]|uniref:Serine incorporator n=1 Tax=Acrasis kona TaxID=1008807 RepID=A0AAW2ZAB9_9EUKA